MCVDVFDIDAWWPYLYRMTRRECKFTNQPFEITEADYAFYKKMDVGLPTISPLERRRRRLSFRNESSLYKRQCHGTKRQIISMYRPEIEIPVYDNDYWWGDGWDAKDFARDFDFNRTFFEQFKDLLYAVPKMARIQQGNNENSTYCNCASYNKNCHLIYSSNKNEDCLYSRLLLDSRNCVDCLAVYRSELCYECIQCEDCYSCAHLENCKNCTNSYYLYDCIGCKNCFGCIGMRNKSYCIFNEQYTIDGFKERLVTLLPKSRSSAKTFQEQFAAYKTQFPITYYYGSRNENVSGNYITNSKNLYHCFETDTCEDCAYCDSSSYLKDAYDVSFYGATGSNELLYECEGVGHGVTDVAFSKLVWGGSAHIRYSYECFSSQHLFGCAGLKKSEYCILNKQYSPDQYRKLRKKIQRHMEQIGEWGEFFPAALSPFCYNESAAHHYFPLTKAEVSQRGLSWYGEHAQSATPPSIQPIPESISALPDDIGSIVCACEHTGQSYRFEQLEISLLKSLSIPLPSYCPREREHLRQLRRSNQSLEECKCVQCQKPLMTAYDRDVLCENCYMIRTDL